MPWKAKKKGRRYGVGFAAGRVIKANAIVQVAAAAAAVVRWVSEELLWSLFVHFTLNTRQA